MPVDRCYELSLNGLKDQQILLEVVKRGMDDDVDCWKAALTEWHRRCELRPRRMAGLLTAIRRLIP